MSGSSIRIVVAVVLIFHGVGHLLGVLPAFGLKLTRTHAAGTWLVVDAAGNAGARGIGFTLWSAAFAGFVAAGLGVLGWLVPQSWWQLLAVGSAVVSMLALVFFWWSLPLLFPHRIGAIVVNVAVFVCLLWFRWP